MLYNNSMRNSLKERFKNSDRLPRINDDKLIREVVNDDSFKLCAPSSKFAIIFNDKKAYAGLFMQQFVSDDGIYYKRHTTLRDITLDDGFLDSYPNLREVVPNRLIVQDSDVIFFDESRLVRINHKYLETLDNLIRDLNPKITINSEMSLVYENVKIKTKRGYLTTYRKNASKRWEKIIQYGPSSEDVKEISEECDRMQSKFDHTKYKINIVKNHRPYQRSFISNVRLRSASNPKPVKITDDGLIKHDSETPNAIRIDVSTVYSCRDPKIILIYNNDLYYVQQNRIWDKNGHDLSEADRELILKCLI